MNSYKKPAIKKINIKMGFAGDSIDVATRTISSSPVTGSVS